MFQKRSLVDSQFASQFCRNHLLKRFECGCLREVWSTFLNFEVLPRLSFFSFQPTTVYGVKTNPIEVGVSHVFTCLLPAYKLAFKDRNTNQRNITRKSTPKRYLNPPIKFLLFPTLILISIKMQKHMRTVSSITLVFFRKNTPLKGNTREQNVGEVLLKSVAAVTR